MSEASASRRGRLDPRRWLSVAAASLLLAFTLSLPACFLRLRWTWTSKGLYPSHPLGRGEIGPFAYFHGADINVGPGFHYIHTNDWGCDGYWVMIQSARHGVSIGVNVGQ